MTPRETKQPQAKKCVCPFCDVEIVEMNLPQCQGCGVTLHYCAKCRIPLGPDVEICPECGGKIK
ncbi:MAG: hypothetical protein HY669_01475 [Chloroflexi bacterium]|nr:hypothetical protein [Chloroflexota bacterium]